MTRDTLRAAIVTVPLIFGPPAVAGLLEYDPRVLVVEFADGERAEMAATSPATCDMAVRAILAGRWLAERRVAAVDCRPGDQFAPGSQYIVGFNAPGDR